MLGKFIRDSSLYSFVALCEKGVAFILFPLLAGSLSTDDLGLFDSLFAAASVAAIFAGGELYQGLARYAPEADSSERGMLAGTALIVALIGCLLLYLLLVVVRIFGPGVLCVSLREFDFAAWLSAFTLSQVLGSLLINLLRAEGASVLLAVISSVRLICYAVASIIFVVIKEMGVLGLMLGYLAGSFCSLCCIILARVRMIVWKCDFATLRKLSAFSSPLILGSCAAVLAQYGDRFFVASMLGVREAGLLGTASRITGALGILLSGFSAALTPLIYRYHRNSGTESSVGLLFRAYLYIFAIFGLLLTMIGKIYLQSYFKPEFQIAASLIPLQVAAMMAANSYLFFPGLSIACMTKKILYIQILSLLLTFISLVIGVKCFGLAGSCLAIICGQVFSSALYAVLGSRYFSFPVPWGRCAIFLCMACLAGFGITRLDADLWYFAVFLIIATSVAGWFMLRFAGRVGFSIPSFNPSS